MGLRSIARPFQRAPHRPPWTWWVGTLAGAALGAVLLFAVYGKSIDPAAFEEQVHTEGLDFLLPASVVVFLALALETSLGAALLLGIRTLWVLVPAAAVTGLLLFLSGRTYLESLDGGVDPAHTCGCFGRIVDRTPGEALWQNLLLFVPTQLLAWVGRPPETAPLPYKRGLGAALLTVGVLVFAGFAPDLPLDDLATRLKPGVSLAELCVGEAQPPDGGAPAPDPDGDLDAPLDEPLVLGAEEGRVCLKDRVLHHRILEWDKGLYLVVLADLESAAFLRRREELEAFVGDPQALPLLLLTPSSEEAVGRFAERHPGGLEPFPVEPALLRPLYRRLPRSFLVGAGVVLATYPDLPPLGKMKALGPAPPPLEGAPPGSEQPGDADPPPDPEEFPPHD